MTCRHGDEEPCLQVCRHPAEPRAQTERYVDGIEDETMKPGRSVAGLRRSGLGQTNVLAMPNAKFTNGMLAILTRQSVRHADGRQLMSNRAPC